MFAALLRRFELWMYSRGSAKTTYLNSGGRTGPAKRYLDRFYLWRELPLGRYFRTLFLHRFWSSDPEGVHDHPWPWWSFVVCGEYWEEHADGTMTHRKRFSLAFHEPEYFHRIHIPPELEGKVVTLFGHGRRCRIWGYIDPSTRLWRPDPKNFTKPVYRGRLFPVAVATREVAS